MGKVIQLRDAVHPGAYMGSGKIREVRELLEETGYVSAEWKHLLTVPSNATIADNYAHIYAAGNCRKAGGQHLDETEFLHVKQYTAKEIETLISNGNFQQAVHILAWLLTQRR